MSKIDYKGLHSIIIKNAIAHYQNLLLEGLLSRGINKGINQKDINILAELATKEEIAEPNRILKLIK